MAAVKLNVKLLEVTQGAVDIIYSAYRQCYSAEFAGDMIAVAGCANRMMQGTKEAFIETCVKSGHESPLEHVKFTFAVEGVSRVFTHQLVRSRIASYSQQSQRYVKEEDFDFIVPPLIGQDDDLKEEFAAAMDYAQEGYNALLDRLECLGKKGEVANQDARFVLPGAAETKIVVTMNCRALLHFFRINLCARNQWEMRQVAAALLKICKQCVPSVFVEAGSKCESLGYCPEGLKRSCGRYPLREDVFKEDNKVE